MWRADVCSAESDVAVTVCFVAVLASVDELTTHHWLCASGCDASERCCSSAYLSPIHPRPTASASFSFAATSAQDEHDDDDDKCSATLTRCELIERMDNTPSGRRATVLLLSSSHTQTHLNTEHRLDLTSTPTVMFSVLILSVLIKSYLDNMKDAALYVDSCIITFTDLPWSSHHCTLHWYLQGGPRKVSHHQFFKKSH